MKKQLSLIQKVFIAIAVVAVGVWVFKIIPQNADYSKCSPLQITKENLISLYMGDPPEEIGYSKDGIQLLKNMGATQLVRVNFKENDNDEDTQTGIIGTKEGNYMDKAEIDFVILQDPGVNLSTPGTDCPSNCKCPNPVTFEQANAYLQHLIVTQKVTH